MKPSYAEARQNMVDNQLHANKVVDEALLARAGTLPRELFVPENLRSVAYVDEDVPLGRGRFLLEPMVLVRLIQTAQPQPGNKVLDIGCASGYSTALLAGIAASVVGVESDAALAAQAGATLRSLGVTNATIVTGPLEAGHAGLGPFDVILINGAVERIPQAILDQLAYGGRLVTVVKQRGRVGEASLLRGNPPARVPLFDAASPALAAFAAEPSFVF